MWLRHRVKRFRSKVKHLSTYLKTLKQANTIERNNDWNNCRHPVLLLYGFGATRRSLSILETRLRQDGFDVFSLNLGGFLELFNTDPIDALAQKVAKKIERLCHRYRLPKLSIIGYSKGGMIGRYYVNCLEGHKRVHTLITLATPHQGNPWVLISHLLGVGLFSQSLRQLLPHSRFIKKLNQTPHPDGVYQVSLASERDRHCPPKYCELAAPNNGEPIYNVVLQNLTHCDFVIKRSAYQEIFKHLKAGYAGYAQTGSETPQPAPPPTTKYSSNNKSRAKATQRR